MSKVSAGTSQTVCLACHGVEKNPAGQALKAMRNKY